MGEESTKNIFLVLNPETFNPLNLKTFSSAIESISLSPQSPRPDEYRGGSVGENACPEPEYNKWFGDGEGAHSVIANIVKQSILLQ